MFILVGRQMAAVDPTLVQGQAECCPHVPSGYGLCLALCVHT